MRKVLKWIMIAIIVVVIAAAGLVGYIAKRVEPERLKKEVAEIVLEQTGRTLTISGDLSLKFFPWLGATIEGVTLSNAKGFGPEPMLSVGRVVVDVKVMPLLSKQIQMGDVVLHDASIRLMLDAKGRSNFDDLLEAGKKSEEESKGQSSAGTDGEEVSYTFGAESLEVESLDILVDNRESGRSFTLNNASLQAAPVALATPMKCRMDFGFGMTEPQMDLQARLETLATLDPAKDSYLMRNIKGVAEITGEVLSGGKAQLNLDMESIHARAERELVSGKNLKVVADVVMETLPGGAVEGDFSASGAELNIAKQALKLPDFAFTAYNAKVSGSATIGNLFGDIAASGVLKLAEFSPVETLKKMGAELPEMQDDKALTSASGELILTYRDNTLNVDPFSITLDGQNLDGKLTVDHPEKPAILFRANVDSLDVDRYLPPRGKETESEDKSQPEEKPETADAADEGLIPVDTIRELNVDALMNAGKLKLKGIQLADVTLHVQAKNGMLYVRPFSFKGYEGEIATEAIVDVTGDKPHSGVAIHVNDLRAGPLAKDFAGRDDIGGNVDLQMFADGYGNSVQDILQTLGGTFKFDFQDGVFPGVDLAGLAKKTKSTTDKEGTIKADESGRTKFGAITGSGVIENGVLANRDLSLMAPNLRAIGDGTLNLVSQKINYTVLAKLVASSKGQGGLSYNELTGIAIPIHLGGTLAKPSWFVDVTQYVKMLGGAVVGTVGDVLSGVGNIITFGGVGKKQEEQRQERQKALRVSDDPQEIFKQLQARF